MVADGTDNQHMRSATVSTWDEFLAALSDECDRIEFTNTVIIPADAGLIEGRYYTELARADNWREGDEYLLYGPNPTTGFEIRGFRCMV